MTTPTTKKEGDNPPETHAKRGKAPVLTLDQIEKAMRASAGVVSVAAEKLGVHRVTLYDYAGKNPEWWKQLKHDLDEVTIDIAETHFLQALKQGKQWAVERALRTKGRRRGYGDTMEMTGPGGGPIATQTVVQIKFVKPQARKNERSSADQNIRR